MPVVMERGRWFSTSKRRSNLNDSLSVLRDNGAVFTGDLTRPQYISVEDQDVVLASWRLLRQRGATHVYAGHGPVYILDAD
jgi:endoribonuclease LACTB2